MHGSMAQENTIYPQSSDWNAMRTQEKSLRAAILSSEIYEQAPQPRGLRLWLPGIVGVTVLVTTTVVLGAGVFS